MPSASLTGASPPGLAIRACPSRGNRLLDLLSADEFAELRPRLRRASLPPKALVQEAEAEADFVHFPTTALLSMLVVPGDGAPVVVATAGREGMVGELVALGEGRSPHRVACPMGGESLRVGAGDFVEALGRCPGLGRLVARYAEYTLRSLGLTLACNIAHDARARACRRLLEAQDQEDAEQFPMTHVFLASMLGCSGRRFRSCWGSSRRRASSIWGGVR